MKVIIIYDVSSQKWWGARYEVNKLKETSWSRHWTTYLNDIVNSTLSFNSLKKKAPAILHQWDIK